MTDTDTRAALDAAIDEWIRLRGLSYLTGGAQAAQTARGQVDRAITAHVEAEVARRLAVAPGVEEAIRTFALGAYSPGEPSAPDSLAAAQIWIEIEAYGHAAALRAAIAADRERAVEAGSLTALDEFRKLLPKYVTPDEARRLVDALSDAAYDAGVAVERRAGDGWRESVEKKRDDTRTALLRALGVEA
mgnify:CR=1 FL=1